MLTSENGKRQRRSLYYPRVFRQYLPQALKLSSAGNMVVQLRLPATAFLMWKSWGWNHPNTIRNLLAKKISTLLSQSRDGVCWALRRCVAWPQKLQRCTTRLRKPAYAAKGGPKSEEGSDMILDKPIEDQWNSSPYDDGSSFLRMKHKDDVFHQLRA